MFYVGALIIIILITFLNIKLFKKIKSTGIISKEVADYEKRINIWNKVAGNSNKIKLDYMDIDYKSNIITSTITFTEAIIGNKYEDREKDIDTFTYFYEIKGGYEKETYEDEPYIIPYLVKESDIAVIIIPGGGFGYKSMDGSTVEGKEVAETLNKNGINAFVLHYRTNPYEYPIPYLDLQRAIRYLRYNSDIFHINKDKITLIGYSAGGNMVGMHINKLMGKDFFPKGYEKDDIDKIDDKIVVASMIYPAISFNQNIPMLFALFNSEDVKNETKRLELLKQMDLPENFNSNNIKQFISYGTLDAMVGIKETEKYIDIAKKHNTNMTVIVAKNQIHGYEQKYYIDDYIKWIKKIYNN